MRYAAMPPTSARRAAVRRPPVLLILRGRTLVRCVPAERWLMSTILCEGQVQSIYTLDKAALDLDRRPPPERSSASWWLLAAVQYAYCALPSSPRPSSTSLLLAGGLHLLALARALWRAGRLGACHGAQGEGAVRRHRKLFGPAHPRARAGLATCSTRFGQLPVARELAQATREHGAADRGQVGVLQLVFRHHLLPNAWKLWRAWSIQADSTRHPARCFTPRTGSGVMRDRVVRSALIASHNSDAGFQH